MLIAALIQLVSSVAAAFATNYVIFIFLRFLIAFSVSGVFECGFVLGNFIILPFSSIIFYKMYLSFY